LHRHRAVTLRALPSERVGDVTSKWIGKNLGSARWPDPAAMNRELHATDVNTLLSVWPHFAQDTQFYDMLARVRS
jgi:hypothetical protein